MSKYSRINEQLPLKAQPSLEIEKPEDLERPTLAAKIGTFISNKRVLGLSLVLLFAALTFVIVGLVYVRPAPAALEGGDGAGACRTCNFAECSRLQCPSSALYVCVTGAAKDGCASTADSWATNPVCDECCSAADCSSAEPGDDDKIANLCGDCTDAQCVALGGFCGSQASYICTDGSAYGGCTPDIYHWPTSLNGLCNSCCDLKSCW